MTATIIVVNATATAIVVANPSFEADRIALEYAYYQIDPLTQARQAEHDATVEMFGGTHIDFAWAKAQERASRRAMPSTTDMLARFREQVAIDRFARAMAESAAPVRAVPSAGSPAPAPIKWDTEGTATNIIMPLGPDFEENFQF